MATVLRPRRNDRHGSRLDGVQQSREASRLLLARRFMRIRRAGFPARVDAALQHQRLCGQREGVRRKAVEREALLRRLGAAAPGGYQLHSSAASAVSIHWFTISDGHSRSIARPPRIAAPKISTDGRANCRRPNTNAIPPLNARLASAAVTMSRQPSVLESWS